MLAEALSEYIRRGVPERDGVLDKRGLLANLLAVTGGLFSLLFALAYGAMGLRSVAALVLVYGLLGLLLPPLAARRGHRLALSLWLALGSVMLAIFALALGRGTAIHAIEFSVSITWLIIVGLADRRLIALAITFPIAGFAAVELLGTSIAPVIELSPVQEGVLRALVLVTVFALGWAQILHLLRTNARAEAGLLAAKLAADRDRDAALAAERAKSAFLSLMSHEIRTPLNGVIGVIRILKESHLEPRHLDLVKTLDTSASTLLTIVNDTLDHERIQAGKMELERAEFEPRAVLHAVTDLFASRASEKGLTLAVACADVVPPALLGDSARLTQILANLISNAIKFTPEGAVDVDLRVAARTADAARLRFEVRDTGIGIAADQRDRIFTPFAQADPSIARVFGGSGLGLSIVKRLIELHGSELVLTSEPGRGSAFAFEITYPIAAAAAAPTRADFAADDSLHGRRILLVEDNPINMMIARTLLTRWGVLVHEATDGEQAIHAAREGDLDAILMDVQMPILDGLAATRAIRRDERTRGLPILGLTADALPETRATALDAGMNDVVTKPFAPAALWHALARAIADRGDAPA